MSSARNPKQCYIYIKNLDSVGRKTWASYVRILLTTYGFGYAWLSQDIGNIPYFLSLLKQRLEDCGKQNIFSNIIESSRLVHYKNIKSLISLEYYVSNIRNRELRRYICLLRLNELPLRCNVRCKESSPINRICKMCNTNSTETEIHFILECDGYSSLREKYIPCWSHLTNYCKFYKLLASKEVTLLVKLAKFIKEAMKCRSDVDCIKS